MLIARCEGNQHKCRGMLAQGLIDRRAVIVIHRIDLLATVQLNIVGTHRNFTALGMEQLNLSVAHWYTTGYFSSLARPTAYIEPHRCRWINLKFGCLGSVLLDIATILEDLSNTEPRRIPEPRSIYPLPTPGVRALFDPS